MDAVTVTAILAAFVSVVLYYLFQTQKKRNYPPGPSVRLPILGHLLHLDPKRPISQVMTELADKYGPVFGLWLGNN
jgi:hypothetical protein